MQKKLEAFQRLLEIMDTLREQCPWDKKQTITSLRTLTLEETYELSDAIIADNKDEIKKELGDLIMHIVFYAKIASEAGLFDIKDVLNSVCDKLIFRHPHVYGNVSVSDAVEVSENWEKLKLKEKDGNRSVLSGVPNGLPALIKAYRMQDKTAQVGFEWENKQQVWEKVEEEMFELKEAIQKSDNKQDIEEEFGDLMFSLVNYARFLGIEPETALEKTNIKFKTRFEYIEEKAPKDLKEMTLKEMDDLWNESKSKTK